MSFQANPSADEETTWPVKYKLWKIIFPLIILGFLYWFLKAFWWVFLIVIIALVVFFFINRSNHQISDEKTLDNEINESQNLHLQISSHYSKKILVPLIPKEIYTGEEMWGILSRVRLLRERKKITQLMLSQCLGFKSSSYISRLESWKVDTISHEQLSEIAKCLDIQVEELLYKLEKQ